MKTTVTLVTHTVTEFESDDGDKLGEVYGVQTGSGYLYVAQGHDFDGGESDYDPITLTVTSDPEEAERLVIENAN